MRPVLLFLALALGTAGLTGCGSEIGDACAVSLDCDQSGSRTCDLSSAGGYCTIQGCDHDSCPDGSVCVRFYVASFENRPCDQATEDLSTDTCALDEVCSLKGQCVPANSEIRFCMKTCESGDDGREDSGGGDRARMAGHGGGPVPVAGERLGTDLQAFCAQAPSSTL